MSSTRMLYLIELLSKKTDPEHSLTFQEILELLNDQYPALCVKEHSLRTDLHELGQMSLFSQMPFSLEKKAGPHNQMRYWLMRRRFSFPNAQLMEDAIAAADFLPRSEKEHLVQDLHSLLSDHESKQLSPHPLLGPKQVEPANTSPNDSKLPRPIRLIEPGTEGLIALRDLLLHHPAKLSDAGDSPDTEARPSSFDLSETLTLLDQAIRQTRLISFDCCSLDLQGQYQLEHQPQMVQPLRVVLFDAHYYLQALAQEPQNPERCFRVDRIRGLQLLDERRESVNFSRLKFGSFSPYPYEKLSTATFLAERSLWDELVAFFGKPPRVREVPGQPDLLRFTQIVELSDEFYSWVLRQGPRLEILEPAPVREHLRELLEKILEKY